MPDVGAFLTGAARAGTRELTKKAEAERRRQERERKLRIMQRASEALQEYQRTGKAIDPRLAAEAASVGFQLPSAALTGVDLSKLEGSQVAPPAAPQVTPGGRLDPGAAPPEIGAVGAPSGPARQGFEAGLYGPREAGLKIQAEQQQAVAREAEAMRRRGTARNIAKYSHLNGWEFPSNEAGESPEFAAYTQWLIDNGQETTARALMKERRDGKPGKKPGTGPKSKWDIITSDAWKAIEERAAQGIPYNEWEPDEKTLISLVFPSDSEREWFLGYRGDPMQALKWGASILDAEEGPMFPNVYLRQAYVDGWAQGDPELLKEMDGTTVDHLNQYYNKSTGKRKIRKMIELGQGSIDVAEETLKQRNMPPKVQEYISGMVRSQYKNPNLQFTPQIIEKDMKERGIPYDINQVMAAYYEALIEARKYGRKRN